MSQNDFTIANQTFPNTRADINSALQALASTSSGSSAPSTTFANQLFYNTTSNLLQIRNEDNDAFITIAELDQTNDTVEYFKSDSVRTALIEFTDGDDALAIADGGALTVSTSLDMNGTELILDADADTSITADTDDRIDLRVGGTDRAYITNNTIGGIINRQNAKPLIINGAMTVNQRGTVTGIVNPSTYTIDRIRADIRGGFTIQVAQSTDVPSGYGFGNSLKLDVTTADASPDANGLLLLAYHFEGQDLQLLKYGTSSAETVTLAFWVKSNKTGTFQVNLRMVEAYHIGQLVTISSANTWEKKVITFVGNTANAHANDNSSEMRIQFFFDSGSDSEGGGVPTTWASVTENKSYNGTLNLGDNTANEVLLTGIQMEVGEYDATTLPPFQHESFGDNLLRCQRYYEKTYGVGVAAGTDTFNGMIWFGQMAAASTNDFFTTAQFSVSKRATPTIVLYTKNGTINKVYKAPATVVNGLADMISTHGFRGGSQDSTSSIEGGFHYTATSEL